MTYERGYIYTSEASNLIISINDNISFFSHFHENIELIYVFDGEYTVYSGGGCYRLSKGDTSISFPFVDHRYVRGDENKIFIAIISLDLISDYENLFLNYRPVSPVIRKGELPECFEHMLIRTSELYEKDIAEGDAVSFRILNSYLNAIIGEVIQKLQFAEYKCEVSVTIENILTYCKKNFRRPELNLSAVSKLFGVSEVYISQVLKKATGHGFSYLLRSMRLMSVRDYLLTTSKSITEIAFECGFSNLRTFNRAFYSAFGCTPSDYRRKHMS